MGMASLELQYHNSMQSLHTEEIIIISCATTIRKTADDINVGKRTFIGIKIPIKITRVRNCC